MTEEEIVGRCVDEIDFSSLVEDVQDVIRHLEETELQGSDKSGACQTNIKKPCENNQNLETLQKITKDTHISNKNTIDQLHTQNITIKENTGKESEKKTQYQRSSCMFQNDQHSDTEEANSLVTDSVGNIESNS